MYITTTSEHKMPFRQNIKRQSCNVNRLTSVLGLHDLPVTVEGFSQLKINPMYDEGKSIQNNMAIPGRACLDLQISQYICKLETIQSMPTGLFHANTVQTAECRSE